MAQRTSARLRPVAKSFLESMRQFLTPEVWKQGHQAMSRKTRKCRWNSAAGSGVGLDDVELRRIAGRTLRSSQGVLRGVSAKATPARELRRGLAEGAGPVADGGAADHRHRRSSAHRGAIADGRRWLYSSGLRWLAANV